MTQRPNYEEMEPSARFAALESLATSAFETTKWRDAVATEFQITKQTLVNWKSEDRTPVWICAAMYHLKMRKVLETALTVLRPVDGLPG